jgi:ABC-type multidrug transport system fused ATPase/permease subunit
MTQGDLTARYPALAPWLARLGNPNHDQLVIGGMLALVGLYAVKSSFLGFLAWWQARFVFGLQADLSQRLFAGYLRQPYAFHLQRNSAQLIRNAIGQVGSLVTVIRQVIILFTEIMVLLGISAVLLAVEPLGALVIVSTLGLVGWGFNRVTRRHILRWGEALQWHEGLRIQHLQQGLGGAKDVKLLGREDDFLAQYRLHNAGSARVGQRQATLSALPRLALELLAVAGLAGLVLVMISQHKPLEAFIPTLGVFAAAAFRLMPSFNRVTEAVGCVLYSLPVVDNLHTEFVLVEATRAPQHAHPLPLTNALTIDQISFRYPSTETFALRGVSLSIRRGACVGFIGGSGAGKSTLVDVLLGLLTPDSGTVQVDGFDIQTRLRGWQDQIGYVPQFIFLTDDTLRRNVAFGVSEEQIDEAALWCAIYAAQLEQFVKDLPQGLETVVGERGVRLSGGQRQRIGIARALYHDPPVLVLDEATSSLDTVTERGVMDAVRALRGEKTLIIVAHRLSTVEDCDRLFRLEQGQVVDEGETAMVLGRVPAVLTGADHG